MSSRFSYLTRTQQNKLYERIIPKYENLSEAELESVYRELKDEYDRLGEFTKKQKDSEQILRNLQDKLSDAEKKLRIIERREKFQREKEYNKLGFFQKLFTNAPEARNKSDPFSNAMHDFYNPEEAMLTKEVADTKFYIKNHIIYNFPEETTKRGRLFHELKAISIIRKEYKEQRTKSLARAKVGSVRSTSHVTKRRMLSEAGEIINCPYCNRSFNKSLMVLDHIYPVSRGGLDTISNTVLACSPCNSTKTNKTLGVFCVEMGFEIVVVTKRLLAKGKDV